MSASGSIFAKLSIAFMAIWAAACLILLLPIEFGESAGLAEKSRWLIWCGLVAGLLALALNRLGAPLAGWLAFLLMVSGAAQLWLSDPNWYKTFQYDNIGRVGKAMYAVILFQASVSIAVLVRARHRFHLDRLQTIGWPNIVRTLIVVGVLCLFSVSLMGYMWRFDRIGFVLQLALSSALVILNLIALLALLYASDIDRVDLPDFTTHRFFPSALALGFALLATLYAYMAFGGVPIVEDETAFLFQAKTFAGGALQAPPLPEGLDPTLEYYLISSDDNGWYASTAPGWPAILAIGVLLGAPVLVNPILGGLSVWLGFKFWDRVAGHEQAVWVALLMASSPWLLGVTASLMTHALCLVLTLGAWWLVAIAKDEADNLRARASILLWVAGLLMGWIFLTRALEGVLLGGLTGLWILWFFGRRRKYVPVLAYGVGCFITGALLFAYNLQVNGTLLETPLAAYVLEHWGEGANAFGFGEAIGAPSGWGALDLWPGHSALEGAINLNNSANSLNNELFGWSIGSLGLGLIYLAWCRPQGGNLLMLIVALVVIVVHFFYWFTGTFYVGPRYWFGAFFAFIVLSVMGVQTLQNAFKANAVGTVSKATMPVVFILCLFSVTVFSSWRGVEKYHPRAKHALIMANYELPEGAGEDAIVILPCTRLFDGAMHRNDPFLRNNSPLFVKAPEEVDRTVIRSAFPDRQIIDAQAMKPACKR